MDNEDFEINEKCAKCNKDLITKNMTMFLFYENSTETFNGCKYLHYKCKDDKNLNTIIDIEPIYSKLDFSINDTIYI